MEFRVPRGKCSGGIVLQDSDLPEVSCFTGQALNRHSIPGA